MLARRCARGGIIRRENWLIKLKLRLVPIIIMQNHLRIGLWI